MPRRNKSTPPRRPPTPTYQPPLPTIPVDLTQLSPEEGIRWLTSLHTRLTQKKARERAYLDRRAARGTHTPTDEAYEADQELETELLSLLNGLLLALKEEVP